MIPARLPRWTQKDLVLANDIWMLIALRIVNFDFAGQAAQNQQNPVTVVNVYRAVHGRRAGGDL
jgi:hypothetical protein